MSCMLGGKAFDFLSGVIATVFCLGKLFSPQTIIHRLFVIYVKWDAWKLGGMLYVFLLRSLSLVWFYSHEQLLSNLVLSKVVF